MYHVSCYCNSTLSILFASLHTNSLFLYLTPRKLNSKETAKHWNSLSSEVFPKAAIRLASFWHTYSCTRKLVQENLRKLHVHTMQVSCSRKWLYALKKSDLQSIVQSVDEFHDRNLPEIEYVLFLPVPGASFLYLKDGATNPVHTSKFSGGRNLRQKLASLNAA